MTAEDLEAPIRPIFLLADSQLLFWRRDGELFLERARRLLSGEPPKAAYVGASNGDRPEFYELFRGAMEGVGVTETRMIPSEPAAADLDFFAAADLILLAGGDVRRGWRTMKRNGVARGLIERYYGGALLIGVSAGAVQLGLHGWAETDGSPSRPRRFETFKLVPYLVDVHAEPDWPRLHRGLADTEEPTRGLGIPSGAGAVLHPDLTLEPVRRPLVELDRDDGEIRQSLIYPPGPDDEPDAAGG